MSAIDLPVQTEVGNHFISNYPPYSQWSSEVVDEFSAQMTQPRESDALGLYVHLPFCAQRCAYCYFRVHVRPVEDDIDRYVSAVVQEAKLYAEQPAMHGRHIECVYFGGGTPTFLSEKQIERLIVGLQDALCWKDPQQAGNPPSSNSSVEEFTVECNPESTTRQKLELFRAAGVTRLSLGFQTLNDEVLRRSGRARSAQAAYVAFEMARNAGFDQINVDLLAGLPGETDESWQHTLNEVLELKPDCVTVYQMELTYNSNFYAAIRKGAPIDLPTWPAKRKFVEETFYRLEEADYRVISSYMALRGDARWRLVYTEEFLWKGGALLGLGESAFGHLQGMHYQNTDRFEPYLSSVEAGNLPVWRALRPTAEERYRREVILLLRLGALDRDYFQDKFGVDPGQQFHELFEQLAAAKMVEIQPNRIVLTRRGLLMAEWLMPQFFLPEHQGVRYT